jgi:PAS domain S-box-containing protein
MKRIAGFAAVIAVLFAVAPAAAAADSPRAVLTIYSQAREASNISAFDEGLRKALQTSSGDDVAYYAEFIDRSRFPGERHLQAVRNYLSDKYQGRRIDALVLVGQTAAAVVEGQPLFSQVPTVFYTLDQASLHSPAGAYRLVGSFGPDQRQTLSLALALHPNTSQVYVVVQTSPEGPPFEANIRRELASFEKRVPVRYLSEMPMAEVISTLRQAPAQSIVLYVRQTSSLAGGRSDPRDLLEQLERSVSLPIYGGFDTYLGFGVVGGYLYSSEANGAAAGALAWRIANGEHPSNTGESGHLTVPLFDARQLKRWKILDSQLPPGSVVRFLEPTFWERYRRYGIAVLGIFVVQLVFIALLLVQLRRRQRAERARSESEARQKLAESQFQISQDRYALATAAGGVGVWDWNIETGELYVDPEVLRILGYTVDDRVDWAVLIHPQDQERTRACVFECAQGVRENYDIEHRLVHRDGSLRWFQTRGSVIPRPDGTPYRVVGTSTDVTHRKDAEELLQAREATLRESFAEIQKLAGRLIAAQETEHKRLARELHDDLSQKVALLAIDAEQLVQDAPDFSVRVGRIARRAGEIATDVHDVSHRLHPFKLEALGLVAAVQSVCADVSAQHGLTIEFDHQQIADRLSPDVVLCMYRIVQESLRNVVKHSHAKRASVRLEQQGAHLLLQIADSGVGFVPSARERSGLGLVSIRERVNFLGGQIVIHAAPGAGTRIGVRVPIDSNAEPSRVAVFGTQIAESA